MRKDRERKPLSMGTIIGALLSLILLVAILWTVYSSMQGDGKDVNTFRDSILALMENVIEYEVEDEYVIIKFPDKDELIARNGRIKNSKGKRFDEFKEGYVIKYKDGTYAFKLTNGEYCAIKNYNDTGVEIDTFEPCASYEINYREISE